MCDIHFLANNEEPELKKIDPVDILGQQIFWWAGNRATGKEMIFSQKLSTIHGNLLSFLLLLTFYFRSIDVQGG